MHFARDRFHELLWVALIALSLHVQPESFRLAEIPPKARERVLHQLHRLHVVFGLTFRVAAQRPQHLRGQPRLRRCRTDILGTKKRRQRRII